jgi:iron complex outermembrane receptor protein
MISVSRVLLSALAVLALMSPIPPAAAQTADTAESTGGSSGLSEIVVTATRREERLQDVPISVAAFSQEKLDAQGLRNIDDLTRLSPGVNFQRNAMSSAGNYNDEGSDINIRGVDSTAGTSTTGIYIDDTPIQTRHIGFGSINAFPALFDLDRVEVLRGPQGTLFGAGAEGGVVRFIAPDPNLKHTAGYFRGDIAATDSGSPSYEAGAAFGAPIIDDVLAFRASVSFRRDGGWVDRVGYTLSPDALAPTPTPVYNGITTQANANYQETTTARLAVKWQVTDALEITPSIYYQRLQIHDTTAYWVALSDPAHGIYRNGNALTNPSDDPFTLSAVKIKWDLGFASLFSNTAFYDRNQDARSDYTQYLRATWAYFGELSNTFPAAGDKGYAVFGDSQRNFYEEVRLASTDSNAPIVWNTGLFFSHLKESVPEDIYDPTLDQEVIAYTGGAYSVCFPPDQLCPNGLIYHGPIDRVVDKQIALFGEVTFKFLETFKATVGLRLSKLDYTGEVNETGPFLGTTIITKSSSTEKPVTPKVLLSWQPNRDNMFYVSATKGFRPGGPNVAVGDICADSLTALGVSQVPSQFSSDSLWSYEIGAKNTLLDHTLQINASLFYIDWNNIQQNVYLPSCGEQFTANLGKAKSEGGDIEILYRPIEALTLDLSAAYTDARLTKTSCAGNLTLEGTLCVGNTANGPTSVAPIASNGDALLGAPWSFTASAEYHFPKWASGSPYLRLDYQHQTAQHSLLAGQNQNNALYDQTLPGLPVVNNLNARAGLRFNGFDISVYGNNLTNAHPLMFESRDIAYDPTDLLYFGRGVRPRTIGVTAIYRY